jgi:hypothetical protein
MAAAMAENICAIQNALFDMDLLKTAKRVL